MGKGAKTKCEQGSLTGMLGPEALSWPEQAKRSSRLQGIEQALMQPEFYGYTAIKTEVKRRQAAQRSTGIDNEPQQLSHTPEASVEHAFKSGSHQQVRKILVDLDSTLFPLHVAAEEKGVSHDPVTSSQWDDFGNSIQAEGFQDIEAFFKDLHSDADLMIRAGVFKHAPQVIKILREQYGVEVHLLTHRSPDSRAACEEWLEACSVEYDGLQVAFDSKLDYARREGIEIVFDDKPQTLLEFHEDGRDGISLDWGYLDQGIDSGQVGAGRVDLVSGWGDALDSVLSCMADRIAVSEANQVPA